MTVLATSREPLAVQAEHCYPVSPLALPERETDPEAVAGAAAVALFCERARAHDPGFEPGEDDTDAAPRGLRLRTGGRLRSAEARVRLAARFPRSRPRVRTLA